MPPPPPPVGTEPQKRNPAPTSLINSIAIVGKQNNPLFIKNFGRAYPDLKYHYIAHISCDVIDERGMLYAMEDLAVYGYMTNTRVKFIVVLTMTDNVIKDADMKNLFRRIHADYIALVSNPFASAAESNGEVATTSATFTAAMDAIAGVA